MPDLAVKSFDNSTRALAGSQAAQQRVSDFSCAWLALNGARAPAAATVAAVSSVFHTRICLLPRISYAGESSRSRFRVLAASVAGDTSCYATARWGMFNRHRRRARRKLYSTKLNKSQRRLFAAQNLPAPEWSVC